MNKNGIKITLLACSIMAASPAMSNVQNNVDYLLVNKTVELPEDCDWGRAKPNPEDIEEVNVTLEDVQQAYQAYEDLGSYEDQELKENAADLEVLYEFGQALKTLYDATDYLRIEAPSYVKRGVSTRFKANLNKVTASVRFYNNEDGYVGSDKSNVEANSYKNMTFDHERGSAIAWAVRGDLCSATGFWVHNPPEISVKSVENGEHGSTVTISYYVDNLYSKAVNEGKPVSLTISQTVDGNKTSVKRSLPAIKSGNNGSYYFAHDSGAKVKVVKSGAGVFKGEFTYHVSDHWFERSFYNPIKLTLSDGAHTTSTTVKTWKVPSTPRQIEGTQEQCGRAGKPYPCYL